MSLSTIDIPLDAKAPNRWRTVAGEAWSNPGGGLWGGYAIGLAIKVLQLEPEARGEAVSLTLTYASALPHGMVDVRTRRIRQGGSIGVWEVELLPADHDTVAVHAMVSLARRPSTTPFSFAPMPEAPQPETLPSLVMPEHAVRRYGGIAFDRRAVAGYPPQPGPNARSLAWVRSRQGPLNRMLLGMMTDNSPPRAMYALESVNSTTLSLTTYMLATEQEIAAVGEDFILVEYDGQAGRAGTSDERSSYWSRDGKLLAISHQLAWYRDRPREIPE